MRNILFIILFINSICLNASTIDDFVSNSFTYSFSVNDYSNTLSKNEINSLIGKINEINRKSDIEYSVCIISSLENYDIREVATSVGNYWDIGATKDG
ncbi:TPM domain-containing protein [Flammeovirga yaeyamensis]|uniref:TPM domain-containing protein n=1 Tax=Flammeovirga yaeyamensis TaxID=367791 RepID=A0AAX1MX99_9BACT|nr:putative membrane protein YgcG [Flammeovirga yaeyamensis]NMF35151.1 TPM domain-containing protein [Flammeovirga yaeyamensis]QWG00029.1 TPM domain-containing protein [Flammeovirga yaeyamensis]